MRWSASSRRCIERDKTGRGTLVDGALVDTQVGVLANQALNYLVSGEVPERIGNAHPNIVPYQVFPVADGHIIIATGNDSQFVKLCGVLGEPALAQKPDYKDNKGRLAHRERAGRAAVRADCKRMTSADILAKLEAVGVPAGPINDARPGVRRSAGDPSRHASSTCRAPPPRAARSPACARRS